jgi:hypothetical protein
MKTKNTEMEEIQILKAIRLYSDDKLESETALAVSREKWAIATLLAHLSEIERRRLYAQRGQPSLKDYCIEILHYPASSAYRRAAAAKFVLEFPETLEKIQTGALAFITVAELYSKRMKAMHEKTKRKK